MEEDEANHLNKMTFYARQKSFIAPSDWTRLCQSMVARADGFTYQELGDDIHLDAKTTARRVYTLEEIHGPMRQKVSGTRRNAFNMFKLTEHGRKVANAIARGEPVPGKEGYRQPKLTKVEEAWIELRKTFKLPAMEGCMT